jgi:hydroxyacylglutathione hydrolase
VFQQLLVVPPLEANCYLLGCEETSQGCIIDPGGDAEAIVAASSAAGLQIRTILLTHGHFDHMAAAQAVAAATGADVHVHHEDAEAVRSPDPSWRLFTDRAPGPLERPVELTDGDELTVGTVKLAVIWTPGHSPGSVCYRLRDRVFTGDTLFRGSVGRTDLPGGDGEMLLRSLRGRIAVLPDDIQVYPGHGPETTVGEERRSNPFLRQLGQPWAP